LSAPQVLLLDEPAAALDANRENQILPFLKRINREFDLPMMLVSHRLSQVRYLTDTMLILNDGRLRAAGQFPAILNDSEVVRLIRGNELLNVLRLRVAEQHPDDGLTTFKFCPSGQEERAASSIKGPLIRYAQETELTATLRPEDVIITLVPVEHASARNQLSGHVKQIVRKHDRTLCWVDVGVDLLADVTHASASELELRPGKRVWCLFKTHAISYPYEHPNETRQSGSELITKEGTDHSETTLAWTRAL
jgi:molybdate transport system ATP-binding protein